MNLLLRCSWQTVNIGDIAHSPGILRVLTEGLPDCHVTLWASSDITEDVKHLIHSAFPQVPIVTDLPDCQEDLLNAMDRSDMLIHGSAASFCAYRDVIRYRERTGKPFGVFGITFHHDNLFCRQDYALQKEVLQQASFVFFRDEKSLEDTADLTVPIVGFGCDGAFAYDIINAEKARETMRQYELEPGKFVCCIPRYRYTPYWKIDPARRLIPERETYNDKMKESDLAPLREAICRIVMQTDLKVFVCPEDATQVALGKEMIFDKLPGQVKNRVAWKDSYWLTDEAVGVYMHSAGLFGCEMHSPIMCVGHGIPAIVARWKEQTTKGYMWQTIGLDDWLFDFDCDRDKARFPDACLQMVTRREENCRKAAEARQKAFATYDAVLSAIRTTAEQNHL